MTITYVIPGACTLDQLNEPTLDGQADEDANDNCVATSLAEGLSILSGRAYVGDQLHDAVYGQGYVGPQAAWKYVQYCHDASVNLYSVGGAQADLVAAIHREVSVGHPVVVTMPSMWGTAPADPVHPSGSTHVGLAVGIGPDTIRVMNPWHGFMQDASDEWWSARLCYGEVWVMEAITMATTVATGAGNPTPFYGLNYTNDSQVWVCPSTGYTLGHGFLAIYQGLHGPMGLCATQILGLPISAEYSVTVGGASVVRQDFERGSLIWDERQAEPWKCYFAAVGQEVKSLEAQLAAAQQKIADLQRQVDAVHQQPTSQPTPQPSPASDAAMPTAEQIAHATVAVLFSSLASVMATALAADSEHR